MRHARPRSKTLGSHLLEFALVAPFLIALLAGTVDIGLALNRSLTAGQVCRNANVLMVRGIDLSRAQNQQLLMRTAAGLGMNTPGTWTPSSSGNGLIVLSKIIRVGPLQCSLGIANWDGRPGSCPNYGLYVIANRVKIGNSSRWSSVTGNPSSIPGANGDISDANIATNAGNRAAGFPGIIALDLDQYTFVSEVFADTSPYRLFSSTRNVVIYMRNLS